MYDLITLGRSSMDFYSMQSGAEFEDIESFSVSTGGSPTNIAVGTSRLGLKVAHLTAVGDELIGKFIIKNLKQDGIDTSYIPVKDTGRSGLAILGVQPPDKFPLVFYRENPADINFSVDDILAAPLTQTKALCFAGTGLARGSRRDATLLAAEIAKANGVKVIIDLDLRPDQWIHPLSYGINIRTVLPLVDIAIGTEEEFYATLLQNPNAASSTAIADINESMKSELANALLDYQTRPESPNTIILKKGADGVRVYEKGKDPQDFGSYKVEVANTVGAGDGFASGLIFSHLNGKSWEESAQFAAACGALVVSRDGCAAALPTLPEVEEFIKSHS